MPSLNVRHLDGLAYDLGTLSLETLSAILDEMASSGQAEWLQDPAAAQKNKKAVVEGSAPRRCLLYWRTPNEWAELIYEYIHRTGHTNSILTVYELFAAEETSSLEFHALPEPLWRRALRVLEESGRAKLFDSDSGTANSLELGIKFF